MILTISNRCKHYVDYNTALSRITNLCYITKCSVFILSVRSSSNTFRYKVNQYRMKSYAMSEEQTQPVPERVILLPVDNSVHTKRAIDWYVKNMMKPNDVVHMVQVVEPIYNSAAVGIGMEAALMPVDDMDSKIKTELEKAKKLVKSYLHELTEKGGKGKGFLRVDSKVGEAIIKVCHEHKVDLVLMGNRGEGLLRRTFLGSVSDYVLHHAERPVVIVPPTHH